MVASAAMEPLALDVVRDPVSDLGGRLDRYAGALSDRLSDFGGTTDREGPSLLRSLSDRWSMPGAGAGLIEVFDGTDFSGLVRHWGSRAGYGGSEYDADNPFVIPIDPVEHVEGITGAHLTRRPDPRRALRPVTLRSQRPAPRPRATERWRPVEMPTIKGPAAPRFSAYPAAMGQAGAIDATLLRFPTAQAEISDGPDRAVVTDAQSSPIPWAPGLSRTPAIRAAEQMSADVGARLAPTAATDVGAWLVPATAPESETATVLRMPRAHLARPRVDARVPIAAGPSIAAFEPRIGPAAAEASEGTSPAYASWDDGETPGVLVEATRSPASTEAAELGRTRAQGVRREARAPDALSAEIAQRFESGIAPPSAQPSARPESLAQVTGQSAAAPSLVRPSAAATPPWQAPASPAPGRALFVPAALARLALQMGETVRPSATPSAQWPWAETAPAPAPTYTIAEQIADGVLVRPALEPSPPATSRAQRTPVTTQAAGATNGPSRPPDARAAQPTAAPIQPTGQTAARIAARVEARLADVLAASATQASPTTLSTLLNHARSGTPDTIWQAQLAAEPALARVLAQVDRLASRQAMTTPLPAQAAPDRPLSIGINTPSRPRSTQLQIEDGLSVLSGAPASATLFSPTWRQASPIVRAMLGAAGFGPEAGQQAGPAFSFGERLAAVAAHLSSRHGLSTEPTVAGGLDAPWFSEPTGTLVLPMAGMSSDGVEARGASVSRSRGPAFETGAANDRPPSAGALAPIAAAAPLVRPSVGLPQALQAALRGAQRQGPGARLRPVPRLSRFDAAIAPDAMAMLTQTHATPPAIVEILARAERLLDGANPISALARAADMPSLIALARLVDAPDAVAALSDKRQAPTIMRALAGLAPLTTADSATPLRAQMRLQGGAGAPADLFESLDAALVQLAADPQPAPSEARGVPSAVTPIASQSASPASVAEALTTLTNALPAAVRAALAASVQADRQSPPAKTHGSPETAATRGAAARSGAMVDGRPSAVAGSTDASLFAPSRTTPSLAVPSLATQSPFATGAIGQTARRAIEWAELAESAAPRGFEAMAIHAGDAAQSPIARRVLAPRAMVADTIMPTWVAIAGRPIAQLGRPRSTPMGATPTGVTPTGATVGRTRAAPIGASARQSLAFAHALDGMGSPSTDAAPRAAWQDAALWTFIASTQTTPERTAREARTGSARTPFTHRNTEAARSQEPAADAGQAASPQRVAMGVPGGRFGWPQTTFQWVQAAAQSASASHRPETSGQRAAMATRFGAQAAPTSAAAFESRGVHASAATAGIASLRSLALSDRILVRSLDGLGVFGGASAAPAADPLRATPTATPRMDLALALPGSAQLATSGAERFADESFARQQPITNVGSPGSTAASDGVPALDVDWVQPIQAVAAGSDQLAPHLRSPGNIGRALDVWVDAVKAEATRSPAAARRALGSVGQLIGQLSAPRATTLVRPSKVLRGSLFDGRSPSAVTIEAPSDGEARPALIRPGEQAARQALRKGTDTIQSSQTTTTEDARHKNSEQTDELIPPEEVERLAAEVIDRIKRELEFDAARIGEDGWD